MMIAGIEFNTRYIASSVVILASAVSTASQRDQPCLLFRSLITSWQMSDRRTFGSSAFCKYAAEFIPNNSPGKMKVVNLHRYSGLHRLVVDLFVWHQIVAQNFQGAVYPA
jgi:hypothetical protein